MTEKLLTALAEKRSVFKNLIWWMKISEFHDLENNPVPLATAINGTLAVKGLLNQWTSWIKSVVSEVWKSWIVKILKFENPETRTSIKKCYPSPELSQYFKFTHFFPKKHSSTFSPRLTYINIFGWYHVHCFWFSIEHWSVVYRYLYHSTSRSNGMGNGKVQNRQLK